MQRADLVGLLRVRNACCLFTWRQGFAPDGSRGEKTVELQDEHCAECVAALRLLAPAIRVIGRQFPEQVPEPCRILVVDDDLDIREELTAGLREMGYEVVAAGTGEEGLAYLLSGEPLPRLILLDLMMPGMTGDDFMDRLRADPRLADLPVVVVTARAEPPRAPAPVIHKPFRMDTIASVVGKHLAP